jgi:hypothetical protein
MARVGGVRVRGIRAGGAAQDATPLKGHFAHLPLLAHAAREREWCARADCDACTARGMDERREPACAPPLRAVGAERWGASGASGARGRTGPEPSRGAEQGEMVGTDMDVDNGVVDSSVGGQLGRLKETAHAPGVDLARLEQRRRAQLAAAQLGRRGRKLDQLRLLRATEGHAHTRW